MTKPKKTRARRANIEISETTFMPGLLKKLDDLVRDKVLIGVHSDDSDTAMIAAIHEFGSEEAGIPSRPIIRSGHKKSSAAIGKVARGGLQDFVFKSKDASNVLNEIGATGTKKTLANFDKIREPALTPVYAKRKGSTKVLVDEQKLRDAIQYTVVPKGK